MRHIIPPILVAMLLVACGSSGSARSDADDNDDSSPGKYEQTWTTPYGSTTCADWHDDMDSHQKFVMSGDMLMGAWKADGVEGIIPPDPQIRRLVTAISSACRGSGEDLEAGVTEIASMLYLMANDLGPDQ